MEPLFALSNDYWLGYACGFIAAMLAVGMHKYLSRREARRVDAVFQKWMADGFVHDYQGQQSALGNMFGEPKGPA